MPAHLESLESPTKDSVYLVEFKVGASTFHRYTNAHQDFAYLGTTFISIPTMSVEIPEMTGGIEEDDFVVRIPRAATFCQSVATGVPTPRITMTVREVLDTRNAASVEIIHIGVAQVIRSNAQGKANHFEIASKSSKQLLDVRMGISATTTCQLPFGSSSDCGINEALFQESRQIVRVNPGGLSVTMAALTSATPWVNGYLELDGLRIGIRDYAGGLDFALKVPPPPRWQGRTVLVSPGCAKSFFACNITWGNASQFLGLGIAIPQYHPVLEQA